MENSIMVQLSFMRSPYPKVAEFYRLLDTIGLDVTILPNTDCGKMAMLLIPRGDLGKARAAFRHLNISAKEREVVVVHMENEVGAIAGISKKMSEGGVSINYAFLGRLSLSEALLVLECDDNRSALRAINGGSRRPQTRNASRPGVKCGSKGIDCRRKDSNLRRR